jgi:tetratricopeptide (TPR) repeat protein
MSSLEVNDDSDADAWYRIAQNHNAAGQYLEAVAAYSAALERDPGHTTARLGRGLALQRMGMHEAAVDDFSEVIERYPEWEGMYLAYYSRALSENALQELEATVDDCNEVLRIKPDHVDALYLRGITLKALGDTERAIEDIDAVLVADARYREAYYSRGTLFYMMGRWEEAIDDFTSFLGSASITGEDVTNSYRLRGIAAHQLGQHAAALNDLSSAIERDPNSATTYLRRSQVYAAMGDSARAEADFNTGTSLMAPG